MGWIGALSILCLLIILLWLIVAVVDLQAVVVKLKNESRLRSDVKEMIIKAGASHEYCPKADKADPDGPYASTNYPTLTDQARIEVLKAAQVQLDKQIQRLREKDDV